MFGRLEMSGLKIEELGLAEMVSKRKEVVKDLLTFRLSLDPSGVKTEGGAGALQKTLRRIDLRIATLKQGK